MQRQFIRRPQDERPTCLVLRVDVKPSEGSSGTDFDNVMKHACMSSGVGAFEDISEESEGQPQGAVGRLDHPQKLFFKHATTSFFSCVDPRSEYAVLGTPGGDIGEFIIALSAVEQLLQFEFTEAQVKDLFEGAVLAFSENYRNRFYMHTDEAAIEKLKELSRFDLKDPHAVYDRSTFFQSIINPETVGCKHLRGMLENPGSYGVRDILVQGVIKSFYNLFLDRKNPLQSKLLLVVLKGNMEPGNMMNIYAPSECQDAAPLIIPSNNDGKSAVNHGAHVRYFRWVLANYLNHRNYRANPQQIVEKMDEISKSQETKVKEVYSNGNTYDVSFSSGMTDFPF